MLFQNIIQAYIWALLLFVLQNQLLIALQTYFSWSEFSSSALPWESNITAIKEKPFNAY